MTDINKKPNLSIIVAIAQNGAIGKDNDLLWHLGSDLKRFKKLTTGHPVVMGRRTWDSLPKKPLPNRRNIVVTLDDVEFPDCETVHSIEAAMELVKDEDEAFVMGGATMYRLFMPFADRLYITRIMSDFTADVFFPTIKDEEWALVDNVYIRKDEKNAYNLFFQLLMRKNQAL